MYNNMYNQFYRGPYMQPQAYQPQPQPIYQPQQPVGIQGKTVDSLEVVKAMDIPLDDVNFIDPLLDYRYDRIPLPYNMFVEDFVASHPKGVYLITMLGHITVVRDGIIYDTFDCRDRKIKDVWKVF